MPVSSMTWFDVNCRSAILFDKQFNPELFET
jgi:hypothetical protein